MRGEREMYGIKRNLDPISEKIYCLTEKYRCITIAQLTEFMPMNSPSDLREVFHRLAYLKGIGLIDYDQQDGMIRMTPRDPWDLDLTLCVWVMLKHLRNKVDNLYTDIDACVLSTGAKPFRLCYNDGNMTYYLAFLQKDNNADAYVGAEYLRTVVAPDEENVRVIFASTDLATINAIPRIPDFTCMPVYIEKRMGYTDEPIVKFYAPKVATIPRIGAGEVKEGGETNGT